MLLQGHGKSMRQTATSPKVVGLYIHLDIKKRDQLCYEDGESLECVLREMDLCSC